VTAKNQQRALGYARFVGAHGITVGEFGRYADIHHGKASAALFIHRNTLRQRLRRISDLIGIDVRDRSTWFDLGLAVRLVRFRGTAGKLLGDR